MDRPKDYQPGDRVPGTVYRVVRMIGAGGMGTVYDVEDTTVGKRYVLKTLHPEFYARKDLAKRMETEARTLARLSHPNIVEVVTAGATTDDLRLPYYVMEKRNGQNLRTILDKKGGLELAHALHIGIDLLDALDNAHEKGVLHRDVKPDNIFLHRNTNGVTTTKLLDFGIMRLLDAGPGMTAGRFMGTLRYAAPEQLRGEPLSAQADLYAAGLVVYEMIAGEGPFDDLDDANKIAGAHLSATPPPLATFGVVVPEALERLVRAALSKEAVKRPKDAFTFAAQLRNVKRALSASRADSATSRPTEVPVVGPVTDVPSSPELARSSPLSATTSEPGPASSVGLAATERASTRVEPLGARGTPDPTAADASAIELSHAGSTGASQPPSSTHATLVIPRTGSEAKTLGAPAKEAPALPPGVDPVDRRAPTHTAAPRGRAPSPSSPERQGTAGIGTSTEESLTVPVTPAPGEWPGAGSTLRMSRSSSPPDGDVAGQLLALLPMRDSTPSPSRTDPGASTTVSPAPRSRVHPGLAVALGVGGLLLMAGTLSAIFWGLGHHGPTSASDPGAAARAAAAAGETTPAVLPSAQVEPPSPIPAPTLQPPLDLPAATDSPSAGALPAPSDRPADRSAPSPSASSAPRSSSPHKRRLPGSGL